MGVSIKGALKRCFCFHSQSDDPSLQDEEIQNPLPSTRTTIAKSVAAIDVQEEDKIEIYVKSEGGEEEVRIYKVPLKYLSYTTFSGLMERSGEDLKKISGGQKINISCKIELFERILNLVKWKEVEAKCEKLSCDDRLWSRLK